MISRALIVEDDLSWQQILSEICYDAGLQVDVASTMSEAIQQIVSAPHRLAILDLSLGGTDHHNQEGLFILDAVKKHDPECLSILLTGYATVELAVNVIQQKGAFSCLRKEVFHRSEFKKLIQQALSTPYGRLFNESSRETRNNLPGVNEVLPLGDLPQNALVVEDDAGWRSLISEILEDQGYFVEVSSSYVEALGALRGNNFSLAVVDLSLSNSLQPDYNQDGIRLLSLTRKAAIPTIIVSGFADPEVIEKAYSDFQIFACLEKQAFDRKNFIRTVNKARTMHSSESILLTLTGREREVLALLGRGLTNKEISSTLIITPNTVKRHLKSLFAKLQVTTRAAASAIAVKAGLVGRDDHPV
ncbi:MAG TPA: response regulator [Anaerolineaceae bacterium]